MLIYQNFSFYYTFLSLYFCPPLPGYLFSYYLYLLFLIFPPLQIDPLNLILSLSILIPLSYYYLILIFQPQLTKCRYFISFILYLVTFFLLFISISLSHFLPSLSILICFTLSLSLPLSLAIPLNSLSLSIHIIPLFL